MKDERLILALDTDIDSALDILKKIKHLVSIVKVGPAMYIRNPILIHSTLENYGLKMFLDMKWFDIPNTVRLAVEAAVDIEAHMMTIHSSGGEEMIRAANSVKGDAKVIGVTVLTSVGGGNISGLVRHLANEAVYFGCDGVVCSSKEVANVRHSIGPDKICVVPGIRRATDDIGDQSRVGTPAEAIKNGASYLVVGRPILQASNPADEVKRIIEEMNN